LSSRSRPPQRPRRSAGVGATLARCRFFGAGVAPCPPAAGCAPPCAIVASELGRKRVEKSLGNPAKSCDRLDSTPPSVCKDCAELSTVGPPCGRFGSRFGTERSEVQILSPRQLKFANRFPPFRT